MWSVASGSYWCLRTRSDHRRPATPIARRPKLSSLVRNTWVGWEWTPQMGLIRIWTTWEDRIRRRLPGSVRGDSAGSVTFTKALVRVARGRSRSRKRALADAGPLCELKQCGRGVRRLGGGPARSCWPQRTLCTAPWNGLPSLTTQCSIKSVGRRLPGSITTPPQEVQRSNQGDQCSG